MHYSCLDYFRYLPYTLQFFSVLTKIDCHKSGDGYCNDETNNEHCNYDGGDCCGSCVNKQYCSQCACLGGDTDSNVTNPLVGDGYCQDETNNADCGYDGGDCCINANMEHCSQCSCLVGGVITSPGFPGHYASNLDMTWLIQVPIGKYVNIRFEHFDLEVSGLSCR